MKANSTGKKNDKKVKPADPPRARLPRWIREGIGLALIGLAGFLFLSLLSYAPDSDPGFFHEISPPPPGCPTPCTISRRAGPSWSGLRPRSMSAGS